MNIVQYSVQFILEVLVKVNKVKEGKRGKGQTGRERDSQEMERCVSRSLAWTKSSQAESETLQ